MKKNQLLQISTIVAFALSSAEAADIFGVTATVNGVTAYKGANNVEALFDSIGKRESIQSYLPAYTDTSAASLSANFRGLAINFSYNANSPTLSMSVPVIGINQTFAGRTREDSQDMLSNWLKKDGAAAAESLMKKLSEVSPSDPIAGNPNSLMSQSVANSFNYGFTDVVKTKNYTQSSQKANAVSVAAQYFSMKQGDLESKKYSLPLSYSIVSDENPDRKYNILLPLAMTDVEGAKVADVGLGFSVNIPITKNWILTPALLYGATASIDLGSLGQVGTASLTSAYRLKVPGGQLGIGNMIGYSKTLKLYSGEYSYDPGIANTIFKNGLVYDVDMGNFIPHTSIDFFASNTAFTGTKLYVNNYSEFGFSYGFTEVKQTILDKDASITDLAKAKVYEKISQLRIGASYLTSSKSKGFQVNFGYTF